MSSCEPFKCELKYGSYIPAMLKRYASKNWEIVYYVYNPISGVLERKRIRLNRVCKRFLKQADFKIYANNVVTTINAQLAGGWTPFGESENTRYYVPLTEVLAVYYAEKERELRPRSLSTYRSMVDILRNWINENVPGIKGIQFNKSIAARYLDYVYLERKVNNTAYNNYLKQCRQFFSWAIDKCYCKENPFATFKKKKAEKKKRVLIPAHERVVITEYFEKKNPNYLVVCHLVFTSLIRPIEISRIRVKQVHLAEKFIFMPSDQTKNGYERCAALSDELIQMLAPRIANADPDDYLIGADFAPGKVAMHANNYAKTWAKMRDALNKGRMDDPIIPNTMQLYSLRDTGINLMIKSGIDSVTVMHAADHHDLSITTRYADHADPELIRTINQRAPKFLNMADEDCTEAPELAKILGSDSED